MLDMGFIPDIEKIVNMLPKQRQTLFFSATMPKEIRRLADKFLSNPKEITVSPPSTMATTVEHKLLVMDEMDKREALRKLVRQEDVKNAFVFCNRKKDVDILFKSLTKHGFNAGRMHGDLVQSERTETLDKFKSGEITLLICSDVAARGIDVADVSHVFNFDVPFNAEDYVHRTGRTGRAGRAGKAFMLAVPEDGKLVAAINKSINMDIPLTELEGIETLELDFTGKKRRVKKSRKAPQRDASPRNDRPARSNNRNDRAERDSKAANAGANAPAAPEAKQQDARPAQQPRDNAPQRDAKPRNERSNRPERQDRNDRSSGRSVSRRDRDDRYDRHDRHDRHDRDDKPVIGFADHVPAFLLTPVPASSLGKPRADEVEKKAPARKTSSKAPAQKVTAEKAATEKPASEKPASEKTDAAKPARAKPARTRTARSATKKASPAPEAKDEAAATSVAPAATPAPTPAPEAADAPAKEEKPKAARRPRKKPAPKKAAKTETADAETTGSEG
jgi:hypothetical protein